MKPYPPDQATAETFGSNISRISFLEQSGTAIAEFIKQTGGNMKYPYVILVLMILLTGCSTSLTTREEAAGSGTLGGGASMGTMGNAVGPTGVENLKRDQDLESSRGRISD